MTQAEPKFSILTRDQLVTTTEPVEVAMVGTVAFLKRKYGQEVVVVEKVWQSTPECEDLPGMCLHRRAHRRYWRAEITIRGVATKWWFRESRGRWERTR